MDASHLLNPQQAMAQVLEILISPSATTPMITRSEIYAVAGRGLEGDRYYLGIGTFSPHPQKPAFEITLIEQENIDAFSAESGVHFTARHARRNLVTRGVDLNSLVGKEFSVGQVLLRALKLCEPCRHLAQSSCPQVLPGLVGKGGLRAQILQSGVIRAGEPIRQTPEP